MPLGWTILKIITCDSVSIALHQIFVIMMHHCTPMLPTYHNHHSMGENEYIYLVENGVWVTYDMRTWQNHVVNLETKGSKCICKWLVVILIFRLNKWCIENHLLVFLSLMPIKYSIRQRIIGLKMPLGTVLQALNEHSAKWFMGSYRSRWAHAVTTTF